MKVFKKLKEALHNMNNTSIEFLSNNYAEAIADKFSTFIVIIIVACILKLISMVVGFEFTVFIALAYFYIRRILI